MIEVSTQSSPILGRIPVLASNFPEEPDAQVRALGLPHSPHQPPPYPTRSLPQPTQTRPHLFLNSFTISHPHTISTATACHIHSATPPFRTLPHSSPHHSAPCSSLSSSPSPPHPMPSSPHPRPRSIQAREVEAAILDKLELDSEGAPRQPTDLFGKGGSGHKGNPGFDFGGQWGDDGDSSQCKRQRQPPPDSFRDNDYF